MNSAHIYLGKDGDPPGLEKVASGKVRDIYSIDPEHLLFVTSDRISAFDVVMNQGVPNKGRVLTAIAAHWFARTTDIVANHLVSTNIADVPGLDDDWKERFDGRIMIVKRAKPDPVEWVVRGYIVGSGWKEYQQSQSVCGEQLPAGLSQAERLPEPILTPTTKEEDHDRPLNHGQAAELVGQAHFDRAKEISFQLFQRGTEELEALDILLADTKFELGIVGNEIILIDEALTPDSSRFWPKDSYRTGISPPSYDKQILRDHLETLDWNKEYPAPQLDEAVLDNVATHYLEICEKITGSQPAGVTQ